MRFIHPVFFMLYGLVSILNHYYFRSAALDYGIANQAMYLYAHGLTPTVTMLLGEHQTCHYLGLHFSLWVPILSPFSWIFGSYTLLIFQNLFLIFGAIGLGKLALQYKYSSLEIGLIQIHYYVFFGVFNALAVDYHDNVLAACLLPWLVYGYHQSKLGISVLAFIGMLIAKENIAIWLLFICSGLWCITKQKTNLQKYLPAAMMMVAVIWFMLCSVWLMPMFSSSGKFEQLSRYSHLGKSLPEIITYVLQHPLSMFQMFYKSHIQPDAEEIIKQEFLWGLLFSGAWLWLKKPVFLWMALPLLMQKLWNKETAFWGVNNHYQIEFAALLSMAIIFALKDIKSHRRVWLVGIVGAMSLVQTVLFMHERKAWFDPMREQIFNAERYQKPAFVDAQSDYFKSIHEDVSVCAQSNFLPHLANRAGAFHFPYVNHANLLIMDAQKPSFYPLSDEKGRLFLDSIKQSAYWELLPNKHDLIILKRKP